MTGNLKFEIYPDGITERNWFSAVPGWFALWQERDDTECFRIQCVADRFYDTGVGDIPLCVNNEADNSPAFNAGSTGTFGIA